jgi:predicted transcriptional regulator
MHVESTAELCHITYMDEQTISASVAPREWVDVLDRAEADIAAGRTVGWDELLGRVPAKIDAVEAYRSS